MVSSPQQQALIYDAEHPISADFSVSTSIYVFFWVHELFCKNRIIEMEYR
jgi:hypothetical protein